MDKNNNMMKFKLSPGEYKNKLVGVELQSISLDSFSATVKREKLGQSMKTIIDDKRTFEIKENGDVLFMHSFDLINTTSTKKEYAIKLNCLYALVFRSSMQLDNDFWEIFSAVNLHINTWPYFREFVQSATQRMSVYPITLPLLKK